MMLSLGLALAFVDAGGVSAADTSEDVPEPEWLIIETTYLTVYCSPRADLVRIEKGLRMRATYLGNEMPDEGAPLEEKIRYQLDALFRRAEEILDMHPADIHVKMKIFRTRREVNDEYVRLFNATEDFKSFYINKYNTIYTSEEDISDSIIAHEMGHAIVDHYFEVIPPEKIRELLASYVDLHLAE